MSLQDSFKGHTIGEIIVEQKVVITQGAKKLIETPESSAVSVSLVKDPVSEISRIKENLKSPGFVPPVFFLTPSDISSIKVILSSDLWDSVKPMCVVVSKSEGPEVLQHFGKDFAGLRTSRITQCEFRYLINRIFETRIARAKQVLRDEKYKFAIRDARNDQESLIDIGKALSLEKDSDKLLRLILNLSKKITGADAGSIFIVEGEEEKVLRFKYSHTFSKELAYEEFTLPMDKTSIAGYVAVTGEVLNIPDVYDLEAEAPVSFNPSFDKTHGYRTKSMLVVPMRNHQDEIIGVIQLINSKEAGERYSGNEAFEVVLKDPEDFEKKVIPFKKRYESLMQAVAGQAAIAIENNRMLRQIENQFEEFVKASVTAIESRDPATSGHSFRVASMCVRMAEAINSLDTGPYSGYTFADAGLKEFEFAGLLHDFGKVYLDSSIFLKEKKLFEKDFSLLILRLKFLYRSIEVDYDRHILALSSQQTGEIERINKEKETKLSTLQNIISKVTELNEPTVKSEDPAKAIKEIISQQEKLKALDLEQHQIPLLTDNEILNLEIQRGSLNEAERAAIESHVKYTYTFVSKIPWPDEYKNIPEITAKHHEKLDGSGYPQGLQGKLNIPLQARIIAIADIFDALNASDRPYKSSVPQEKILDILREEAISGKLDSDLVDLFIRIRAWEEKKPSYQTI